MGNPPEDINSLKTMVSELAEEVRALRGSTGFATVRQVAKTPGVPFGEKKLRALFKCGAIRGFEEQAQGGKLALILDTESVLKYCEQRCGPPAAQVRAEAVSTLKEMGLR